MSIDQEALDEIRWKTDGGANGVDEKIPEARNTSQTISDETGRWDDDGGAPERAMLTPKELIEHNRFGMLLRELTTPLNQEALKRAAKDLGPKMHKRWVADRKAEGRTVWLRKHGLKNRDEIDDWLSTGGTAKHLSLEGADVRTALEKQTDIPESDRWQYFNLLKFDDVPDRGPGEYAELPPVWIGKNESAAEQNIALVNKRLEKGSLSSNSLEEISREVHENWVLSNFNNRIEAVKNLADAELLSRAKAAHTTWEKAAYGSAEDIPAGQTLEQLRQSALVAIDTLAQTIRVQAQETSKDVHKQVSEVRDQLSSWDHMSVAERLKDYAVVNETVGEMATQAIFMNFPDMD